MPHEIFKLSSEDWLVREEGYHPRKQNVYETLFTLGNGYLSHRGSLEENSPGSYRGTYVAGIFDKSESFVTEVVKVPGWVDFSIWYGGEKFDFSTCKVLEHERILDMKKGILHRVTRFRNKKGKILKIETRRVIFAHQVRGSIMEISITPENFSGGIKIISGINGDVTNIGYYPYERIKHFGLITMHREKDCIYLESETRDSKTRVALAASLVLHDAPQDTIKVNRIYGEKFAEEITFQAEKGNTYHMTKWASIITSREGYERQLKSTTVDLLRDMQRDGLAHHIKKHIEYREKEWERADIEIKGDRKAQKGIRFNLYHLLIAKPHHDPTVSIGAKFLTGEGYKGHVFWDTEVFILPFYIYTFPEEARGLLMYRYYTLKGMLQNAKKMGYKGAKVAWESADTGEETTPDFGYLEDGTEVKIFTGDEEHHIVSDVVFGIYNYYNATGDSEFLYNYGAELIFETARFWMSRVEKRRDRYEIRKVIGPDEFHEHVDNNAFTNYLVMWHLKKAVALYGEMTKEVPQKLKLLTKRLRLTKKEIDRMAVVSKTIFFPFDQSTNLIEQFEGYFSLRDYKVGELNAHGLPEFPKGLDLEDLDRTQLLKQADVVLLLYLFIDKFPPEVKKKNFHYYEERTMHKSSLSPCIYGLMGLEIGDHKKAYNYFMKTSYIDLVDANKNAGDGIHAAAAGGAWMNIIHGFAGMRIRFGNLCFDPWLPKKWQKLSFNFVWQGSVVRAEINHKKITFKMLAAADKKGVSLTVSGKIFKLKNGESVTAKTTRRKF
ncbi:MAG: glycoside hydrolase family 65 protein [Candidatus Margulisbacteria bacterium]|nr:glycoside hydrolase family 65 protein [Candidatus Margulisiibacteriota bacterium]MBU1021057.1 glycoside hydrolase family 65 protein [Candidatus Margulisiibacteriota bacterium]MBU1729732.1 glycoside hydrolase family 65 protein [Candidatus Margulisiibacteriota bacterium]MBU1955997.1 glycoside hydrolase family 65 protein [Candidatus Margulisiibacteriota bacterium]